MPSYILQRKFNSLKNIFYQKHFTVKNRISSKASILLVFSLIIVSSVFYLWQTNSVATKGYTIKELDDKVADLRQENKKLELTIAELRSTERVAKEIEHLQMVSVARVEYLKADGSAVALNR